MWTITFIRRHIFRLTKGSLFVTRDFLSYGSRAAVDQSLSRLVKQGIIRRLARGVFARDDHPIPTPSALEIATIKAAAFGKQILTHGLDAAAALGLVAQGNREPTYCASGRSTSFQYGSVMIHLCGTCPRKMALGDSRNGLLIRALWQLGRKNCDQSTLGKVRSNRGRTDREQLRQSGGLMPQWMWSLFGWFQSSKAAQESKESKVVFIPILKWHPTS